MALFLRLDSKIWDFFNFYDEKFWLLLSMPVTIFVIACILLFVRESKRAKEEERAKKKWIKILFIIGTVVGIIELIAYIQVLIKLVLFNGFEDRFRELTLFLVVGIIIFIIVSITRFIKDAYNAKIEERSVRTNILVMFIIAMVFLSIVFVFWVVIR